MTHIRQFGGNITPTVFDQFCGAGGSSAGAARRGLRVMYAVNHWQLVVESHSANFPDTFHDCADVSRVDPARYGRTDVLITSPECFPAGTLILTERGLVPIEKVVVGDNVLTHKGRWMAVTQTMTAVKNTIILRGQGHGCLETTAEHPFYVREQTEKWDNAKRDYNRRVYLNPEWIPAKLLTEHRSRWATPVFAEPLAVPEVGGRGATFTVDFWWMVGRWLGDGSLRIRHSKNRTPKQPKRHARPHPAPCEYCGKPAAKNKRYPHLANFYCSSECKNKAEAPAAKSRGSSIQICCAHTEAEELARRLNFSAPEGNRSSHGEYRWSRRNLRTAVLFDCPHNGLVDWLLENFGQHASGKTIPAWALTMPLPWRQALLDGYLSADGHSGIRRTQAASVSKRLALGIRLLAESLGKRVSFNAYTRKGGQIEGRPYAPYVVWSVAWETNHSQRAAFGDDLHSWSLVKNAYAGRHQVEVFNLSVAEDESYVADGIVVHNCTNHSLASGKKREAQADLFGNVQFDPAAGRSRATAWDVVRFAEVHRYNAIIVENVVDFRKWRLFPEWLRALHKLGYEWQVVYINAMFAHMHPHAGLAVGDFVPQSRDRMFVVLWRKGLPRPDLDFRPLAPCQHCGVEVEAVQSWKKPGSRWGRWGERGQYVYRCPVCANVVTPYYYAAANVIDWRLPMQRIGDRQRPLKPRTMERIQAGLDRFWDAFTVNISQTNSPAQRVRHVYGVLPTQTATQSLGLVVNPFIVYTDHGDNSHPARDIARELPAQTARQNLGVVVPAIVSMRDANRSHYQVQPVEGPLPTQVAAGIQQWLLATPAVVAMRNVDGADHFKTAGADQPLSTQVTAIQHGLRAVLFLAQLRNHQTAIGVDEPLGTVTAGGLHHALVMSYYSHSVPQPVEEALPTVTTVDRHSLIVSPQRPALEDCLFRMLTATECKLAQSFPRDYVILGSQRDQVRQIGNANPPVLMDALLARVAPIVQ